MESLRPSHRRKLSTSVNGASFSAKNEYEDVLTAPAPEKCGGAVWDYAEIFGSSRGSSSIPVLDLSGLEGNRVFGSGQDFRSSEVDYSMIFGGFGDEDVALPYEDVVGKRAKLRASSKARTRSHGSDHFTSSETNKVSSSGTSDQSIEEKKQFNMSYHKTSPGTEDGTNGMMTHIAQLHAVPGFAYFIDETSRLKTAEGNLPLPRVKKEEYRKRSFSGEINKKSSELGRSGSDKFHFSGNLSNAHEPIPESDAPKASKPSSSRASDLGLGTQSKPSHPSFKTDGFQRAAATGAADSSSPFSDEELDENSPAAALKRAIEKAQESIRLAKELMEKQKGGVPVHQKRSSKSRDKEHRKGRKSSDTKAKNLLSHNQEEGVVLGNSSISPRFKQSDELFAVRVIKSKENIEVPEVDAAERWLFEMLNGKKHETPTVMSQSVEEKNFSLASSLRQEPEIKNMMTVDEIIGLREGTTGGASPAEKSSDLRDSDAKMGESVTNVDLACALPEPEKSSDLRDSNANINYLRDSDAKMVEGLTNLDLDLARDVPKPVKSSNLRDSNANINDLWDSDAKMGESVTNLDLARVVAEPEKSGDLPVINEFEISEERGNALDDLGNLEKMHKLEKEENFEFQKLENDTLIGEVGKPSENEKETQENFECDEQQKVVEDDKQINRRVRKTWNRNDVDLAHIGNGLCVENEDSPQAPQEGEENDERSNGISEPEIHECVETERPGEEHITLEKRAEEDYNKTEIHDLENKSEKQLDEEHARVEEPREVLNNVVSSCTESTDESTKNQPIEAKQGAEEIDNLKKATDIDDVFLEMNVASNVEEETRCMQSEACESKDVTLEGSDEQGVQEFESTGRAIDTDEDYQERDLILNGDEETSSTQSGANECEKDVTPEAAVEQEPRPTFSDNNCTSQVKENIVETNEHDVPCKETDRLQGGADTFSEPEENYNDDVKEIKGSCNLRESEASDNTVEFQSAHEVDICQNGKQDAGEELEQEIPNELGRDSETDSSIENLKRNVREDFETDSLTSSISDENVIEQSDNVPEVQTSEKVGKSGFSEISIGEKVIADNAEVSELSSDNVNDTIKKNRPIVHNEADKNDVQTVHKESNSAENQKQPEPSQFPSNKNGSSTAGEKETKTEQNKVTNNAKKIFVAEENEAKKTGAKVAGDKDQSRKAEASKKERERDRDRIAVERAIREARERAFAEARERAERAAVEKATAEARQRVLAEAREKVEKSSAGNKTSFDKASAGSKTSVGRTSAEAKLRAERAAVERATAEARSRALEKALSQKTTSEVKVLSEKLGGEKNSSASRDRGLKHSFSSSDLERIDETSESAQRRKARLERHQRIMERAAKALAEKNMRDLQAQKEQAERNRLAETLDADIKRWASGKEGNLRALLSTLQYILGPDSGWQPISLTEIITTTAVKKAYRKATLYVHPDKLQQRGASIQQKYICEKVFDLLKAAWNKFNSEER